jgi:hypothetical protein
MKSHSTFIFESYLFDEETGKIELRYSLDHDVEFTETLLLPTPVPDISDAKHEVLDKALFALHLIGGISYYKTCLPKEMEIRSGALTKEQAAFWNAVYENGLGEFFYRNKIDFRGLINFPAVTNSEYIAPAAGNLKHETRDVRVLVPLGGGKDSMVTVELLKKAGLNCTGYRMGKHPILDALAEQAGIPMLTTERHLSPVLFDLNAQGALNGHVPITAYLSFVTIILSIIYDFDAVAVSNERSANIGNVEYLGKEINHQWSKSLEFEQAFQNYVHTYITKDIEYFSPLRPLSELSIAKLFCEDAKYLETTTSCNTNWRILKEKPTQKWCGVCPKCAFVFALYSAFLPQEQLTKIFNKNLFADEALLPLYRELLDLEGFKPFECVGTPEETKAALYLAHERGEWEETAVMKMFVKEVLPKIKDPKALLDEVFAVSGEHGIPEKYKNIIDSMSS